MCNYISILALAGLVAGCAPKYDQAAMDRLDQRLTRVFPKPGDPPPACHPGDTCRTNVVCCPNQAQILPNDPPLDAEATIAHLERLQREMEGIPEDLRPTPQPEKPFIVAGPSVEPLCANAQTRLYDNFLILHDPLTQQMLRGWWDRKQVERLAMSELALWNEAEKSCGAETITALTRMYVEWSTKMHQPPPAFTLAVRDAARRSFSDQFAAAVRQTSSYTGLLDDQNTKKYFEHLPLLTDPFFDLKKKLRTSVEDPQVLNSTLAEVKKGVLALPANYQSRFHALHLYITMGGNDLRALCKWEMADACYSPGSDTIYILPSIQGNNALGTIAHELEHALVYHLPKAQQAALQAAFASLVALPEAQRDVVHDKGLITRWKDGTNGRRYHFVRAYGASNVDEFGATYVEDMLANNGVAIVAILKTEYRRGAIKALKALSAAGLFGPKSAALLQAVYHNAGLGREATTQ